MALSTTMQDNSHNEPYAVELAGYSTCGTHLRMLKIPDSRLADSDQVNCFPANDVVGTTVKEVGKQFHRVFMVDDTRKEIMTKLTALEKRIDSKSLAAH